MSIFNGRGRFAAAGATVVILLAALGGCREEEQNRPLQFEKGVYSGAQDEALSEEARDALRGRVREQGALTGF